jgi:GSH-dependent disulfide-bond oxidoreductase
VFESGAILLYLADKTGKFIAKDLRGRTETIEWLFWQMGNLGPMSGQNNHFSNYAVDKIPYAMDRYRNEVNRLYGVMNRRLADHEYLGGAYSIADMASYPWVTIWERQHQNIEDFPHIKRWLAAIKARPAVIKAYEWTPKINPGQGGVRTAEERAILFGQTAASVKSAADRAAAS